MVQLKLIPVSETCKDLKYTLQKIKKRKFKKFREYDQVSDLSQAVVYTKQMEY